MTPIAGLILLCLVQAQVPPPNAAAKVSDALHAQRRSALGRESSELEAVVRKLVADGNPDALADVRKLIPPASSHDGAIQFFPLNEVALGVAKGLASVPNGKDGRWRGEVLMIRSQTAKDLFELAKRAATSTPKHYALADACLREVVARSADHPEARRLLGFVPYQGGWATPFAIGRIKAGMTSHPIYGWVNSGWVPHLERGELPSRSGVSGREVWLPAEQADSQRRDFSRGWEISTEHFKIKTNVSLSEAIVFGRNLETLHEVFESLFADVIGENSPLARRFKTSTAVGEAPTEPHYVSYFATRDEYVSHVRPLQGEGVEESLGIYIRAQKGRGRRGRAYFFRDHEGQLDVTATLHHEVSHQLLFESGVAGPDDFLKNVGNYWVFEGLGTYFETLTFQKDGHVEIGGLVGARLFEARKKFQKQESLVPLAAFIRFDKNQFEGGDIYKNYQQANAFATFLMSAHDGAYREGFLDYVRDACKGALKRTSGKSLEDRVDRSSAELEAELITYLQRAMPSK